MGNKDGELDESIVEITKNAIATGFLHLDGAQSKAITPILPVLPTPRTALTDGPQCTTTRKS